MFEDAFTSFPVLQTDRLVLRKLVEKDAGLLDLCLSDPDWLRFTDYPSDFDFSKEYYTLSFGLKFLLRPQRLLSTFLSSMVLANIV